MSRQVKRSSRAAEDLYEIAMYLLKDGLPAAERFLEAPENSLGSLAETPLMGRPYTIAVETAPSPMARQGIHQLPDFL
jgi:plasmid stabilization system protein ParE